MTRLAHVPLWVRDLERMRAFYTGDGYYEAVVEDSEGNRIEIVA